MTTPEVNPTAPPIRPRVAKVLSRKTLTTRRAAAIIACATLAVTAISGVLMHFIDKTNFPSVGGGLWWAIQTVTTVGYGDVVPTDTGGKVMAALVMIVGIGFLTVVTAAITSVFIESSRRRMEASGGETVASKLDQISARLDAIEVGLKAGRRNDSGASA